MALSAFNMRAITNFNEVTYHFLRAIFEHLHLTKGQAGAAAAAQVGVWLVVCSLPRKKKSCLSGHGFCSFQGKI